MYSLYNTKAILNINGATYTANVDFDSGYSFEDPRRVTLKRGSMGEGIRTYEGLSSPFSVTITVENIKNSVYQLFLKTFQDNLNGLSRFSLVFQAENGALEKGELKYFDCVFNEQPRQKEVTQDGGKIELIIHSLEEKFTAL